MLKALKKSSAIQKKSVTLPLQIIAIVVCKQLVFGNVEIAAISLSHKNIQSLISVELTLIKNLKDYENRFDLKEL